MKSTLVIVILLAILGAGFVFKNDIGSIFYSVSKNKVKKENKGKIVDESAQPSPGINVAARWELPHVLQEISGISWLSNDRIACIQDETGTVFIYNLKTKQIEKEIAFAGAGDYEGIALIQNTAWVVRSDGQLYEVADIYATRPSIKEYATGMTEKQNIEGLCYDKSASRLLLAVKDKDLTSEDYKGVYAFDLKSKKLVQEPVYKISVTNEQIKQSGKKKKSQVLPSAIAIHPGTGNLYITDGPKSMLLMLDSNGNIASVLELGKEFLQPEGITFSPSGEMFISNEGGKGNGNILQVTID